MGSRELLVVLRAAGLRLSPAARRRPARRHPQLLPREHHPPRGDDQPLDELDPRLGAEIVEQVPPLGVLRVGAERVRADRGEQQAIELGEFGGGVDRTVDDLEHVIRILDRGDGEGGGDPPSGVEVDTDDLRRDRLVSELTDHVEGVERAVQRSVAQRLRRRAEHGVGAGHRGSSGASGGRHCAAAQGSSGKLVAMLRRGCARVSDRWTATAGGTGSAGNGDAQDHAEHGDGDRGGVEHQP